MENLTVSSLLKKVPGIIVILVSGLAVLTLYFAVNITSQTKFCITCHAMETMAATRWANTPHASNSKGIVAECVDCHINPGIVGMLKAKLINGSSDLGTQLFGEADPEEIEWDRLALKARSNIKNAACQRCHKDTTDQASKAAQTAHSLVAIEHKRCLECHVKSFHPSKKSRPPYRASIYTAPEVAQQGQNGWIIYQERIYDVSQLMPYHSGGTWSFAPGSVNTALCDSCHSRPEFNNVKNLPILLEHYFVGILLPRQKLQSPYEKIVDLDLDRLGANINISNGWRMVLHRTAMGGRLMFGSTAGVFLEFEAEGDIQIGCLKHQWSGFLDVYRNDEFLATYDLYSPEGKTGEILSIKNSGNAKIRIEITGSMNDFSKGTQVWLDFIRVTVPKIRSYRKLPSDIIDDIHISTNIVL